jgi:hypothetical protein
MSTVAKAECKIRSPQQCHSMERGPAPDQSGGSGLRSIRYQVEPDFGNAHDCICDQCKKYQQHPDGTLQRIDHGAIDLQNPLLKRKGKNTHFLVRT